MQQFFLFCTMLIITSEAFSEKLHGSQISTSIRRKSSRFAPRHKYLNPGMFDDLNSPMLVTVNRNPDYEASYFVPKREKNHFSRRNRRFSSRKKIRKKSFKEKQWNLISSLNLPDSFIFDSPQSFKNFWLLDPEFHYEPHENCLDSFGDIFDSQRDVFIRNPNQYIVCFYPVFNHLIKKTYSYSKKPRFSTLKRHNLIKFRNKRLKNKRSANNLSGAKGTALRKNESKVAESENHRKDIDANTTDFESLDNLSLNTSFYTDKNASVKKISENSEIENHNKTLDIHVPYFELSNKIKLHSSLTNETESGEGKEENSRSKDKENNIDIQKPDLESPHKVKLDQYSNLDNADQNSLLSPTSNSYTGLYSSYFDVTQPSLTLPKITFKYPYDLNLYETSLRRESQFFRKPVKKEACCAAEKSEALTEGASPQNIGRLKQMLDEVESALISCSDETGNLKEQKSKKKDKKKKKHDKNAGKMNNSITIKEKIDTLAIPILREISEELTKISNGSSSSSSSSSSSPPTTSSVLLSSSERNQSKSASKKTAERCSLNGTWTSTVLGLEMIVTAMPNMMLKVSIGSKSEGIINKNWSIHGLTLAKHGGPLMFAAIYPQKRKIASFLGQCKICKDQDLIFGAWTIYSCVKRYTDLWRAVETKLDILRKKKV